MHESSLYQLESRTCQDLEIKSVEVTYAETTKPLQETVLQPSTVYVVALVQVPLVNVLVGDDVI